MEAPRRILIYGVTGSGKTTLARRVAERLGLPFHPVDDLCWRPGWVEVPMEEQLQVIGRIVEGDSWVLDSAYGKWFEPVLQRAELVVALDLPGPLVFWQLVRRTALRCITGEPCCNGNRESFRKALSHDSILLWFFRSRKRKRSRPLEWAADPARPRVVRLTRRSEVEDFVRRLPERRVG
ncbi:MAG: AAA family ATPase [Fimbriimonadaceae bacterium]|nr:AAA family ATPase [Fimbriimonadaceae bacterium]